MPPTDIDPALASGPDDGRSVRLPDTTRLGQVTLQVADLERSLSYYREVIGLVLHERHGAIARLGVPDGRVLVELRERAGAGAERVPRRGRLGLFHFAILLPDRAALGRFVAHLAARGVPAGMSDHLVSEAIYLTDPDGLGIEVYADRPRSAWRMIDGEVAMATEPLDVDAVVAAAAGAPWTGVPAGTVIGHLHLHVGDLARSERFYRDGVGFEVTTRRYPGALFLAAGGYHHHLGTNIWAAGAEPAGPNEARLLEWEVVVPEAADAERALASIEAIGATVERDPQGGIARDPWGTAVRVRSE